MFSRYALQKNIADAAVRMGVEIKFGITVVEVDQEKPSVRLKDGGELTADLIIGADGEFRSVIWILFNPLRYHRHPFACSRCRSRRKSHKHQPLQRLQHRHTQNTTPEKPNTHSLTQRLQLLARSWVRDSRCQCPRSERQIQYLPDAGEGSG